MPLAPRASALNAAPPRTSAVARLVNVIVDPVAAFRDIREVHPWVLAVATAIGLRFLSLLVFYDPELTPLKIVASLAFQLAAVVPPLLVGSLLTWLAAKAWRLDVSWRAVFSICANVNVAHILATIVLASIAGALLPGSVSIDVRHPPFTNLGSFVGRTGSAGWLHRLAAEADVRSAYAAVLLWLGLRAAGRTESEGKSGAVAAYAITTLAVARVVDVAAIAIARG